MQKKLCCPKCKSRDLQYSVSNNMKVTSQGGGYSGGKGCLGFLLFGPLGLLCGSCGSKQKTTTQTEQTSLWVCKNCGNKFKGVDEINSEIASKNNDIKSIKLAITLFIIMAILMMLIGSFLAPPEGVPSFIIVGCLFIVIALIYAFGNVTTKNQIVELEKELQYISKNAYIE